MTELDQLRAQLAEAQAENKRLKKQLRQQAEAIASTINKHHAALAAEEARETKLLEGVSVICGPVMCAYTEGQRWEDYQELLTQPRDDSALREMIAGVYEECVGICDRFGGRNMHPHECRDAIRALAEKKLASLTS